MNFRTTLILFVLVAAGLVFFIVANRSGTPDRDASAGSGEAAGVTEGRKLLDLKPDDVRRLVIRPAEGKGQVVELVKAEPEKSAPGTPPPLRRRRTPTGRSCSRRHGRRTGSRRGGWSSRC